MQINKIAQKLVQKLNNTKQCQPMSVNVAVNLGCDRVTETQHYTGMGCSHGHAQLRLFRRRMIEWIRLLDFSDPTHRQKIKKM